jgi:hypothetical protein
MDQERQASSLQVQVRVQVGQILRTGHPQVWVLPGQRYREQQVVQLQPCLGWVWVLLRPYSMVQMDPEQELVLGLVLVLGLP